MQSIVKNAQTGEITVIDWAPEQIAEWEAQAIIEERNRMTCSPAQMRIALHRAGLLPMVQEIASSDPEASIVWEYATQIVRNSPLIAALGTGNFTEEQIDGLFAAAMEIKT